MQALNMRRGNCRRSAQAEQQINCIQKTPRIRCCGRVIAKQEVADQLLVNKQGQGQGRGQGVANGQGRGQGLTNS